MSSLNEKCALFGAYVPSYDNAAFLAAKGLFQQQHRGQEGSGIVSSNGEKIFERRGRGLVTQVFDPEDCNIEEDLPGTLATGHNRYSTSNGNGKNQHLQPVINLEQTFTLAHNGNIPDTTELQKFLEKKHIPSENLNDSEMMHAAVGYYVNKGVPLEVAAKKAAPLFTGAYSLLLMDKEKLVAMRDPHGLRPLSLGKYKDGYVVASETCAFTEEMRNIREIAPGEIMVISDKGFTSQRFEKGEQKLDLFEFIYFARPDSQLLGQSVYEVRHKSGELLAMENPKIKGDIVIDVPNSGLPAAIGFAKASGIPKETGFIKNTYSGRVFIDKKESERAQKVREKLSPLEPVLRGKRVIVVDDSIVRGVTPTEVVKMIRDAGAAEVHMMIASPPVKYPDFYGIDTPNQKGLLASSKSIKEMKEEISADSLSFLSYESMIKATGLHEDQLSTSAFTGEYVIDLGKRKEEVEKVK